MVKKKPAKKVPVAMVAESWPVKRLKPDPKNARKHDEKNIEAIKYSLKTYGQQKNIVVTKDGTVIAGNGTLEAAKQLKWTHLLVNIFKGTPSEAKAYTLADNRTAELASWEDQILLDTIKELQSGDIDMDALGFSKTEIDKLILELNGSPYQGTGPSGTLAARYVVPPFSVLDIKQGYWQDRKRDLLAQMGEMGQSRENALGHNSMLALINNGVSILDPVLSEIVLHWFAHPTESWKILDPFAGDHPRGVLAGSRAFLNRFGIEIFATEAEADCAVGALFNGDDILFADSDRLSFSQLVPMGVETDSPIILYGSFRLFGKNTGEVLVLCGCQGSMKILWRSWCNGKPPVEVRNERSVKEFVRSLFS